MKDRKRGYQIPLDSVEHLPAPEASDLQGLSEMAVRCLIMHAGKVASVSGSIHEPVGADAEGDPIEGLEVPGPEGDVPVLVVSYLSDEKVMEDIVVCEGGMEWEKVDGEDVAVISLQFNRRWSAYDLMRNGIYAFYEILEVLSHEIAHAFDGKNTRVDPEYLDASGEKKEHKYGFNESEVRARLWSALVVYCHAYVYASLTDRWDDHIKVPAHDGPDEAWDKFCDDCPTEDLPLDEFNEDNRGQFITIFRKLACDIQVDVQCRVGAGEFEGPPGVFYALEEARDRKLVKVASIADATDQDKDRAYRAMAEHALETWLEDEQGE